MFFFCFFFVFLFCFVLFYCVSLDENADDTFNTEGIVFQVGENGCGGDGGGPVSSPSNPNCFAWCLMNLCTSRQIQQVVRKMVAAVGLEVLGTFVCA